jgi:hypothetical protein
MPVLLLAATLPILFWDGGTDKWPQFQTAAIHHLAVSRSDVSAWANITGLDVEAVDTYSTLKLPVPGITFRVDEASASRRPWLTSNGSRILRQPDARFLYDVPAEAVALAAAEAFCFGGRALIHVDQKGIQPFASILRFLTDINSEPTIPIADIGVLDDGSGMSGEILNLLIRDNLLFALVRSPDVKYKLLVELGSKSYSGPGLRDPDAIVHRIRTDLTDAERTLRLFGTSVVVARLTGNPDKPRLHLLNYGAPTHVEAGGFRVRVLGSYSKAKVHAFEHPDQKLLDYEFNTEATEFTIPELKAYTVVDLSR